MRRPDLYRCQNRRKSHTHWTTNRVFFTQKNALAWLKSAKRDKSRWIYRIQLVYFGGRKRK